MSAHTLIMKLRYPLLFLSAAATSLTPADLVAYFTFDNADDLGTNAGTIATDWNVFEEITQTPGRFGDGAGSFVSGTSRAWDADFNVGNLEAFSISLHVKSEQEESWDDFISIGTGNSVVFVFERNNAEGISLFNIGQVGGATTSNIGYSPGADIFDVDDGEWHHLGMTVGNGTITLYVDGEARNSTAYDGSGPISAFQIASRFGDGQRTITSEIDDVAVYDETLEAAEMAFLATNPALPVAGASALEIVTASFDEDGFALAATGLVPGRRYQLTRSSDLASGFPETVGDPLVATGDAETFRDLTPPITRAFYRIEEAPE